MGVASGVVIAINDRTVARGTELWMLFRLEKPSVVVREIAGLGTRGDRSEMSTGVIPIGGDGAVRLRDLLQAVQPVVGLGRDSLRRRSIDEGVPLELPRADVFERAVRAVRSR